MSNNENQVWLESAVENFAEAIEGENFELAKEIMNDTADAGFIEAAKDMRNTLRMSQAE